MRPALQPPSAPLQPLMVNLQPVSRRWLLDAVCILWGCTTSSHQYCAVVSLPAYQGVG